MSNILARWQGKGFDHNQQERKAEREWAWILSRVRLGDCLDNQDDARSLGSNWGRFSRETNPETYLLKDLNDMVSVFDQYLAKKKKSFSDSDIAAFIAWKFWEAKIQFFNVISPEIYPCTIEWQQGRVKYAGLFEACHHALKTIRADVAKQLFDAIYPAIDPTSEVGKPLLDDIKKKCDDIMRTSTKDIFEKGIQKYIEPSSSPQIEASEEE